jgi:hypothetical protein
MFDDLTARHTKIEKVISIKSGKVILEDHNRYPLNESNLYFLSDRGELIWSAERPTPDVHYIRVKLDMEGEKISAYTTGSHACDIDLKSGKLISHIEFK